MMRIPNADYLERTGSELLGARLWRMPPNRLLRTAGWKVIRIWEHELMRKEEYKLLRQLGRYIRSPKTRKTRKRRAHHRTRYSHLPTSAASFPLLAIGPPLR